LLATWRNHVKLNALGAALLLGCATLSQAQEAPKPPPAPEPPKAAEAPKAPEAPKPPAFTFAMKGFVSMSAVYQNGAYFLSEGQHALAAAQPNDPPDKNSLTFDVRQSRFNFSVKGPQVLFGATPSAVLEFDWFQGFGGGNFGDASLLPRMRLAYSELNWGNHRLQLGQQNDLIFAMAPTSLSHIAFPLAYFTGNLGWRRPGIFGFHVFEVAKDVKVEGAWEVARSTWADVGTCPVTDVDPNTAGNQACGSSNGIGAASVNNTNGISLGEASSAPAVEGRVTFMYGKMLSAFVAGHWNQVDLSGMGSGQAPAPFNPTVKSIAVTSYNAGAKLVLDQLKPATITVQGAGFVGQNVSPLIGDFISFRLGSAQNPDVQTVGYWAQAGVAVDKLSLWGLYGNQKPDKTDKGRGSSVNDRIENTTMNVILMYRDGGYGISAEWINFKTTYATAFSSATVGDDARRITATQDVKADQYLVTANYFF
jgi:hypothetical protein